MNGIKWNEMTKKIRFIPTLWFLCFCFTSCGANASVPQQDGLVGVWKMTSKTVDGSEVPIGECAQIVVVEYKSNGTGKGRFATGDVPIVCKYTKFVEFTWKRVGTVTFETYIDGQRIASLTIEDGVLKERSSDQKTVSIYTKV